MTSRPWTARRQGRRCARCRRRCSIRWGVETAILTCDYAVDSIRNPDAAAALASAVNDWLVDEWLDREPRLRAALVVPIGQPAMAAVEVHRLGGHPGFVAVHLPVRSAMPYGNRGWWPLLDAITEHDLVAQLHFGGSPGLPPTASGWPSTCLEEYVDMASAFQSQLLSLVAEGTFDRYPGLRVALLEAGFAWLPAFLWRADKGWRGLRREVPWLTRAPSAYVREHVRVGLQPVDGPPDAAQLAQVVDQLGAPEMLMFATDCPHRHRRRPRVRARRVAAALTILSENARSHYSCRDRRLRHPQRAGLRDRAAGIPPRGLAPAPQRWAGAGARGRGEREKLGDRSYLGSEYPRPTPRASRIDAWPPDGVAAGVEPRRSLREQLLDRCDVEYGVLNPLLGAGEQLNLESARRSRRPSTTGRPPSGSTRSRDCARRSSSPTRTASCPRARSVAARTTRASCRCSCSSAPPSRSGAASTGRSTRRRPSAACRSASTTAAGAAGR